MAQRVTGTNNNYKIYVRLRQNNDIQENMITATESTVAIKDPSQKGAESQTFQFNKVFRSERNQEVVWSDTTEPILQKLIEGHNGVVMSYGQTGAGKSYTIFGEDERFSVNNMNLYMDGKRGEKTGLVCRTADFLFKKAQELEDIREFVITCSMSEIYLDKVRDLGKAYQPGESKRGAAAQHVMNNYEGENLQIKESSNGQVQIQDLTQITIKNIDELYELISAGFLLRDKFENKGNQTWSRAHTIFTINLVQKDKENENIPFLNSTIQFVDLAGSERIAKSLTENQKFQEAILINSSLTSLSKCLQMIAKSSKSVPYRESKLTKILQNCMTYSSHTILFVNLNCSDSNYEECLSSLQYAERTRNAQLGSKQSNLERQSVTEEFSLNVGAPFTGQSGSNRKLLDEIQELKSRLETNNRDHREKLAKITDLLGLDIDFNTVLTKQSYQKLTQFKQQKEAQIQLENIKKQNQDYDHKIEKLSSFITDLQTKERLNEEQYSRMKTEQTEVIQQLKDKLRQLKMQQESTIQKLSNEREFEIKNLIERSNQLLEEKANMIINLPNEVDKKTSENQKVNDIKKATKYEVEKELKSQIENLQKEYKKLLDNTKQQYEYFLKQKNEEMDDYVQQLKRYRERKTTQLKEYQIELQDLYDIIQKQNQIIIRVETGQYSGGIRSFNIPKRDKPHLPNRQKHKNLFHLLDQSHFQNTLVSQKTKQGKNLQQTQNDTYNNTKDQFQQSKGFETQQRSIKNLQRDQEKEIYDNLDDLIDLQVNLNKIVQDKNYDQFGNLKAYTERIKDSLHQSLIREKDLKKKVQDFELINSTVDIQALQKERDEFKTKYMAELKKHNQSRVTVESQKRLISAKYQQNFMNNNNNLPYVSNNNTPTQFNLVRPHTVQDRRFNRTSTGTGFYKQ